MGCAAAGIEWTERVFPPEALEGLVAAGHPRLLSRILASRGVTARTAEAFLDPASQPLASPSLLPGAVEAAEAIVEAVAGGRKVVVFGDYDCDGVCASAILVEALRAIGANVAAFIPERLTEGYGMTDAAIARLLSLHPDAGLVVTVDNGVNSVDAVASLRSRGMDVVVTDHHLPGDVLPDCIVANPKVAASDGLEGLCGAGVAFMVAAAAVSAAKRKGLYSGAKMGAPLLVMAGLATVADIMPLVGQNRVIVAKALARFFRDAPRGLRELFFRASRAGTSAPCARDFGFLLAPRINAAGRLASGSDALELLLCRDPERARSLAVSMDVLNAERKGVEKRMTDAAFEALEPGAAAQTLDIPGGHRGVAGIVAARVMEKLEDAGEGVPVCVVVDGHGSARAPQGYNVRDALAECAAHLLSFGGHAAAGGLRIRSGETEAFRAAFSAACARQRSAPGFAGTAAFELDAWIGPDELTEDFVASLSRLEPFGEGNPEPVFAFRGVRFSEVRPIGDGGKHLRLALAAPRPMQGVWWNHGGDAEDLRRGAHLPRDVAFTASVSEYGGRHVEFRVLAVRLSA